MTNPEQIEPQDQQAYDAWYDAYRAGIDDGREYPVTWTREELRVKLLRDNPYWAFELWAVRDASGEVVGALHIELPLQDNTFLITAEVAVRPDARRRGFGTQLARTVEERAAAHGRTVVHTELNTPLPTSTDDKDAPRTPGQAFARLCGLTPANIEVHRALELPLAEGLLERLAAEAAEHHAEYRLVSWRDRCPDELVDAYAALKGTFALEAPQGELEVEAQVYDAARVRAVEEQSLAQGRHGWITVAVAPDGTLAGQTELYLGTHAPDEVFQWGTLVSPAHRGHRLGLALKVQNHRELQRSHPERLVVHTWNAETNTAMNAVNAKLGFRPVELGEEWHRTL